MIGTKLAHYEITSQLGTGGMGEVYRARDTKLGRDVAIKVLPRVFTNDSERLARFDRDVLGLAGVKWLMIMEGINDIGQTTSSRGNAPAPNPVTPDDLIGPMKQMIERAHTHGIKVVGCTLTPYEGAGYYSEKGEEVRQAVNRWMRTGGAFDAVVDFEKATQDSANPKTFKATFNNTDHLHPNDAGYKAMADSIDLKIFSAKSAKK